MFRCENLLFRKPVLEDVNVLQELKNNKKAAYWLGGFHHTYTIEDIIKWVNFHNSAEDELLLVIEDLLAHKIIGHVGLYKINHVSHKAEIGILIADDNSRGKGYGTKSIMTLTDYAFRHLKLHKVTAEVLQGNMPSINMFTKCGYRVDGCLRDDVFKNNRYYDVLCMSILNNDKTELE